LPANLIATEPVKPRDMAKLFVYDKLNTKSSHSVFNKLPEFLKKGDVLVLNNTRVIPARLIAKRIDRDKKLGRKFKLLLLEKKSSNTWLSLIDGRAKEVGLKLFFNNATPSRHSQAGRNLMGKEDICFDNALCGEIVEKYTDGIWEIKFNKSDKDLEKNIFELGQMPLPPYIKQEKYKKENKDWYQTVYAKYIGSVAAPTAGLHFTKRLIEKLKKKGVQIEYITLHVGMGTFLPVKTEKIEDHKIHKEFATISPITAKRLNKAKKEGRRVIAVGTTSARTLEAFSESNNKMNSGNKDVDIFIYPPYVFKYVDGMITNFHLPKSTLLMMISALLSEGDKKGIKKIKELYEEAIRKKYHFYSYGDAMLII